MSPLPTRRTVLRASAWSAPAITLGATAPAYAGSSTPGPAPTLVLSTGHQGAVRFTVHNPTPEPVTAAIRLPYERFSQTMDFYFPAWLTEDTGWTFGFTWQLMTFTASVPAHGAASVAIAFSGADGYTGPFTYPVPLEVAGFSVSHTTLNLPWVS